MLKGHKNKIDPDIKPTCASVSAGNGWFWQQNITQVRKSFITQSKLMIF